LKSGGVGSSDPDTDGGVNWELIPTQAKVDAKANISGQAFSGNISAPNLSGTNTGDQDLSGKADKATTYTETEVDDLIATRTESPDETAVAGTATFTNSTNNIALTGIGSIGLEIGDVVQVTGTASNNKLFTVEVITDSGNVIVNQAHAGGTTTKSLVNETVSATVTLLAKWFNASPGLGQGPVDVTALREFGVVYTGIPNRQIFVMVSEGSNTINREFFIDGEQVFQGNTNVENDQLLSVIIPAGSTYEFRAGYTLTLWTELR
jgi:hypothetical protein